MVPNLLTHVRCVFSEKQQRSDRHQVSQLDRAVPPSLRGAASSASRFRRLAWRLEDFSRCAGRASSGGSWHQSC